MKTFSLFDIKNTLSFLPIILGFLLVSCSSYHNSSYYDSDGIYTRSNRDIQEEHSLKAEESRTGSYFTQFQDYYVPEEETVGIFTDIDSYYGEEGGYSTGYSGWGNSVSNVSVNVYGGYSWGGWYGNWGWGSPYWSYGLGWNSWYYPSWGWSYGWNSWYNPYWYGYGWNSWYNPYYPYYGNYAYNRGPRNGYYSDYAYRTRVLPVNAQRSAAQNRMYEVRGRNENVRPTRSDSRFTTNATRNNAVQATRSANTNSTRNSSINSDRNDNSTINSSRSNTNTNNRSNTINSTRNNTNRSGGTNTINRSNNVNRSGTFNSGRSTNSPSMNRSGNVGGSRSSGMGGGATRSSSGRR